MRIIGAKAHAARLRRIAGPQMEREVGKALEAAADLIEAEAHLSITAGSVSSQGHVPSRPGEPPNYDTGVLTDHIETARTGPLEVQVSSNAPYAAALEFGTSKMAERPYMRPAAKKMKREAVELVRQAVRRVVRA